MKTIALFGGSGGLGSQVKSLLEQSYKVIAPTSSNVNLTNFDSLSKFFNENNIDIVINLSGANYDSFLHKLNPTVASEQINKVINVNVLGNINLLAAALPKMRESKYGRIILTSSVLVEKPTAGTAIYSATKAFVDNLVKTASVENISKNITCNSMRLGYFDGGMAHRLPEKFAQTIKDQIGLKRFGSIEELYKTIIYIIENEYITGQNLNVSGGI